MVRHWIRALVLWAFRPTQQEVEAAFDAALKLAIREAEVCALETGVDAGDSPTLH
jgi:hypothetical protein